MPPVRTSAFLTGIIKNCIYDYVLSLLYVDTICNWFLFTTFPAGTVIYRTIIWCNMLLYCLLLGLVVITQPVIFKTFNINSTRHLLLDYRLFACRIWNRYCFSDCCVYSNICYYASITEPD